MATTTNRGRSIPLNCVDKCELALDGIDEPATTYAILDLEGDVDTERLKQAIFSAQKVHLRTRTIVRRRRLRLIREIEDDLRDEVLTVWNLAELPDRDYEGCIFEFLNRRIDVRKEFPFRALVLKRNDVEWSLMFTFHHSALDGIRALVFVRSIIEHYNNELSEASRPPEDARIFSKKDELFEFAQSQRSRVDHYYRKMFSYLLRRFILEAFRPPTRVFHDKSGKSKEMGHYARTIQPAELKQLVSGTTSAGVELNDLLLAALYMTVDKWNRMHGKASKKIRVMLPVNMSPKGFRHIVSNQAAWLTLSTMPEDRADPARLLKKVRSEAVHATQNRRAFSLVYFFYFSSRFPLVIMSELCRFLIITRTYIDSILLTNLGPTWPKVGSDQPAITGIGGSRILSISGSTSVVSPMGLSICLGTYGGNLSITVAYRPAMFSSHKIRSFLDLYVEQIGQYKVGLPAPAAAVPVGCATQR